MCVCEFGDSGQVQPAAVRVYLCFVSAALLTCAHVDRNYINSNCQSSSACCIRFLFRLFLFATNTASSVATARYNARKQQQVPAAPRLPAPRRQPTCGKRPHSCCFSTVAIARCLFSLNQPLRERSPRSLLFVVRLMFSDVSSQRTSAKVFLSFFRPRRFLVCGFSVCRRTCQRWRHRLFTSSLHDVAALKPAIKLTFVVSSSESPDHEYRKESFSC